MWVGFCFYTLHIFDTRVRRLYALYVLIFSQLKICAQGNPVTATLPNVHQKMETSTAVVVMATLKLSTVSGDALVRVSDV